MPKTKYASELYIGLMSGTSLDGIDAGLVDFSDDQVRVVAFHYQPFPAALRQEIHRLSQPDHPVLLADFGALDAHLGQLFAEATLTLLDKAGLSANQIQAIGSHGQTVFHAPNGDHGFSLQIADPNRIAEMTGITTIADFRRRDIAVGGQGAPLVPAFHQALFHTPTQTTTVLNIGGIANITVLTDTQVLGFDTGPGNTFLDYWCANHLGQPFDAHGAWASRGQPLPELLAHLLDDVYFRAAPPKSTGKEYFSPAWLQQKLTPFMACRPEDIQATLCRFSADSIAEAILSHAQTSQRILICGGGVHNPQLLSYLQSRLPIPITSTAAFGIDPDHVEAIAFAWLARQNLHHKPGNLCSVTGAARPVVLGGLYPGRL